MGLKHYCDKLVLNINANEILASLEEDLKLAKIKVDEIKEFKDANVK